MEQKSLLNNKAIRFQENLLPWILISVVVVLIMLNLDPTKQFVDETFHLEGIKKIQLGEKMSPALTVIPGYHFIIGNILKPFGLDSLSASRFISFILSFSSIVFVFLTFKVFKDQQASLKALSIFLSPIIFPLFFLLYTDLTALSFVLGCLYFSLKQKYHIAGIIGLLSFLMRQTNIVWIAFIYVYILLDYLDGDFSWKKIRSFILPSTSYIICGVFFIGFVLWNKGISMGDKSMHPDLSITFANPIFFLFVFGVLFLPYCLANVKTLYNKIQTSPILWLIGSLVFVFIFFNCTFNHYYNTSPVFIRNVILIEVQHSIVSKLLFTVVATFAFLTIYVSEFKNQKMYFMYPLFLLLIASSTLVEQRYYIVGMVLFVLFLKDFKGLKVQLLYSTILTTTIWYIITNGIFFL